MSDVFAVFHGWAVVPTGHGFAYPDLTLSTHVAEEDARAVLDVDKIPKETLAAMVGALRGESVCVPMGTTIERLLRGEEKSVDGAVKAIVDAWMGEKKK